MIANKQIAIDMLKFALFENQHNQKEGQKEGQIKKTEEELSRHLFKKINMAFKGLNMLIKILILKIEEKKYQDAMDQKIIFPHTIDALIIIIGTFNKAFNQETTEILYNIVSFHAYDGLYSISNINSLMIPFVDTNNINYNNLKKDYDEFSVLVKEFTYEVLNLNTDFEPHGMIEYEKQNEEQGKEQNEEVDEQGKEQNEEVDEQGKEQFVKKIEEQIEQNKKPDEQSEEPGEQEEEQY
jgi:hypothetical protein